MVTFTPQWIGELNDHGVKNFSQEDWAFWSQLRLQQVDKGLIFSDETNARSGSKMPVPLMSVQVTDWMKRIGLQGKKILEFGGGSSTEFYSRLCGKSGHLLSLETNQKWLNQITEKLKVAESEEPGQQYAATIVAGPLEESNTFQKYSKSVMNDRVRNSLHMIEQVKHQCSGNNSKLNCSNGFDMIVLDSSGSNSDRTTLAVAAVELLSETGIIILDNPEWCKDIVHFLRDYGFYQIDFCGLNPGVTHVECASAFLSKGVVSPTYNEDEKRYVWTWNNLSDTKAIGTVEASFKKPILSERKKKQLRRWVLKALASDKEL
eukprot:g6432.t1